MDASPLTPVSAVRALLPGQQARAPDVRPTLRDATPRQLTPLERVQRVGGPSSSTRDMR